jgi:hypothetical protein
MLTDNIRFKNGCKTMQNMVALTQGPARRRSGFEFVYDISSLLGGALTATTPRLVPFIFNEESAYTLVFYLHNNGNVRVVFGIDSGLVEDSLNPGNPYVFEFTGTMELDQLSFAQSADILFITQPNRMPIAFKRNGHDDWEADEVAMSEQPFTLNIDDSLTITPSAVTGSITLTASSALFDVNFEDLEMKVNGGRVVITSYTSSTVVDATVTVELEDTTARADWSTPEWSPVNGYPEFVAFFEQRIAYGSIATRPQTIWCSKSGDYYDFGRSDPIVASDGLTFTLDAGEQNKIQWMATGRQLLVGTLGDEWTISGSGYEPLSFQSIMASRHTNNGAEKLRPLMIGPVTIFLERLGRTVNQFAFDYNRDAYVTVDLSVLAPHLTENYTIVGWAYQQTPNGIVWCVREDGYMIALTFKREHNVTGWHVHITDGLFKSVASIPGDNKEDEVWTLVQREINGTDKWYLEVMAPEFKSDDMTEARFLDSFLVYDGVAATTISGLSHLEGCTVEALGDGSPLGEFTVSGGAITLQKAKSHVVIGLPYVSELRPYFMDYSIEDGATISRIARILETDIFLYHSLGLEVGRYDHEDAEEYMDPVPFRKPSDIMGEPVPVFEGVKPFTFTSGYDRDIDLIIRQTQPLPLTVLGLVDRVAIGD